MDSGTSNYLRFLDGDEEGIVEIIKDYKDGLMLYLNEYVRNIHVAEDLTEDTFVKIVTKKPRFSGKSSFRTWLYAIGRNVAKDYLRRNRVQEVPVDEMPEIREETESLEEQYIKEEEKIALRQAMDKLNPQYKQVLWLVYFEDFSNAEVAVVMKKSIRNVETLLYRAKQSLKTELNKEGFVYERL